MRARARVAICGGGVAAIEALLALRELLVIRPHIDLVAPNPKFVYQPMSTAEAFGQAETELLDIADIAAELEAELHLGELERVDSRGREVVLASGTRLPYDAVIIAIGARRGTWLEGATPFRGAEDVNAMSELLARVERGRVSRLAFAAPPEVSWALPLYELALLTASRLAERGVADVVLTVLTPESDPLAIFGTAASRMLRDQLADRGIHVKAGVAVRELARGELQLSSGETIGVDEVVALPRLEGPRVAGLPADANGFIPIDDHCRVVGLEDAYAAGDGADFPIKQGGLAAQQADVAAESIAAGLGAPLEPAGFAPLLRGLLLTGVAPLYLRGEVGPAAAENGDVASNPLWWPSTKIAGRFLGPYLAELRSAGPRPSLEDRPPAGRAASSVESAHREARELALGFAEADARIGDFRSALSWLGIVERLDGVLPGEYLQKRDAWRNSARG
jgi:sulfide:quinone oxidoreductase